MPAQFAELFENFSQAERFLTPWLFWIMLVALTMCFLGYPLFRLDMLTSGILYGAFAGWGALQFLRPQALGVEQFLACLGGAALLGAVCWFLYRAVVGAYVAATVMILFVLVTSAENPGSVMHWVFGGLFGIGFGVLTMLFLRQVVMAVTALFGALAAVLAAAVIIAGGPAALFEAALGPEGSPWLLLPIAVVAAALTVAGVLVQIRLTRLKLTLVKRAAEARPPPKTAKDGKAKTKTQRTGRKRAAA